MSNRVLDASVRHKDRVNGFKAKEEVLKLGYNDVLHYCEKNSQGGCERWKINGKVKRWKRQPNRFEVPIKHGLYSYGYLRNSNVDFFHLERECIE